MKKDTQTRTSKTRLKGVTGEGLTVGLDVGDQWTHCCVLDRNGDILTECSFSSTKVGLQKMFGALPRSRVALETGIHSPWMSRQLAEYGHEVVVAHAQNVRLISESKRKDDRLDARMLARLARIDPQLLSPVRHRSAAAQAHLSIIRARAVVVGARTAVINAIRGLCKSFGERLRHCDAACVGPALSEQIAPELQPALLPLLEQAKSLSECIKRYEKQIEQIAREEYPETAILKQVNGVGILTALTYVLTIEEPDRFRRSRDVGCYLGLRPGRRNYGQSQPQLHISKEGNTYLRVLLVQSAHYMLGRYGTDSDLRRWGLKLAERGGKNGKRRAIVAVARKLAVLLHKLWITGEVYRALRRSEVEPAAAVA